MKSPGGSRETKASLKCAQSGDSPLSAFSSLVHFLHSLLISSFPPLSLFVTFTTKTAHYAKEFVRLSRSKSLSRVASYCRRALPPFLHSLGQRREYFLLIADVKAKSFKPFGSFKRFPLECLISAGFHSSHARLLSQIEIECLNYLFAFARRSSSRASVPSFFPSLSGVGMKFISKQGRHSATSRFAISRFPGGKALRWIRNVCRRRTSSRFAERDNIFNKGIVSACVPSYYFTCIELYVPSSEHSV